MKAIYVKVALEEEIAYPLNVFFILTEMEKENPFEYNVIQDFIQRCKKERKDIQDKRI